MILMLAFFATASADIVTGKVVDADTGLPLADVDVSVNYTDASISWTTDSTGTFGFYVWNAGRVVVKCQLIGYNPSTKVDYSSSGSTTDTIDVGIVKLRPTAIMTPEVQVNAKMPRFTMSGDTIIFHPEAFKLSDGARLSELIRKLPGVREQNGALYWNDKPLRLMVNGKNIFGGGAVITELPAEVADNIKLYDRKSELSRHTGKDDGVEDNVLDIKVKPGFLDKWYGNVDANYMTSGHYMAELKASRLSDKDPVMAFGQLNNENQDVEMVQDMSQRNSIANFGKAQFGSFNYQHNWQPTGTEHYTNSSISLNPCINHYDGQTNSHMSSKGFMEGEERTWSKADNWSEFHHLRPSFNALMYAYLDKSNTLMVNASVEAPSKGRNVSYSSEESGSYTDNKVTSRQTDYATSESTTSRQSLILHWDHFLKDKGMFSISSVNSLYTGTDRSYDKQVIDYFRTDSTLNLYQYSRTPTTYLTTNIQPDISLWITPHWLLKASNDLTYTLAHNATYNYTDTLQGKLVNGIPTTEDLANREHRHGNSLSNTLRVNSEIKLGSDISLRPSLEWVLKREKENYRYGSLDTTAVRHSSFLNPSFNARYKIDNKRKMDFNFGYSTSNPDFVSTFGYVKTTNPQTIEVGNPNQKRSHSYNLKYSFNRIWQRQQFMLHFSTEYHRDINPFTILLTYNPLTASYHSMPVNVKGGDNLAFSLSLDRSIGSRLRMVNDATLRWVSSYEYLTRNSIDEAPQLNHQRNFNFDNKFELSYEASTVQASIYDDLHIDRYRYSLAPTANSTTVYTRYGLRLKATLMKKLELSADAYDDYRHGFYSGSMNGHKFVCNAKAVYSMLKNKLKLYIEADDIFNKNKTYNSSYSALESAENWSDSLHHYVKFGFQYILDAKGQK